MRTTPAKLRRDLIRRATWLDLQSTSAPPYETYEWHLVRWALEFPAALATLRAASPRVAAIVPSTVVDLEDGPPLGAAIAAMPLDVLATDEAMALCIMGWELVRVIRVWPGDSLDRSLTNGIPADSPLHVAHATRAARVAERAGPRLWTYYRSTGWGFVYPKPAPKSRRPALAA